MQNNLSVLSFDSGWNITSFWSRFFSKFFRSKNWLINRLYQMNRKFSWNSASKLFVINFLPEIRQGAKFLASDLQQWGHGSFLAFKTGQLQLLDPLSFHPRSAMKKQLSWLSTSHFVFMHHLNDFQSSFLNPHSCKNLVSRSNTLAKDLQYVYNKQHHRVYYSRSGLWKRVQL